MARTYVLSGLLAALCAAGCTSRGIELQDSPAVTQPDLAPIAGQIDRNPKRAFKNAVLWLQAHPESDARDQALILAARGLAAYGNPIKAYYYLDELQDTEPESPLVSTAMALQYQIADELLAGFKMRFAGLPLQAGQNEAIEMLYRIRERAPGSRLAEHALLRTADHYYDRHRWDLAAMAYSAFVESYPGHPDVMLLRLKQASANLKAFHNIAYDPTPLLDARAVLLDLIDRTQDPVLQDRIALAVADIDQLLDDKLRREARFYRRINKPDAAEKLLLRLDGMTEEKEPL